MTVTKGICDVNQGFKIYGADASRCRPYESNADVRKFADAVTNAAAGDIIAALKAVKNGASVELVVADFMETATRHIVKQTFVEKAAKAAKSAAAAAAIETSIKSAILTVTPRPRPVTRTLPGLGAIVEAAKCAAPEGGMVNKVALARTLGASPTQARKLRPAFGATPTADAREKDKADREIRELEARLGREAQAREEEEKRKSKRLRHQLGI